MKRMMRVAAAVLGLGIAAALAETEVVVQYPYPDIFNKTHEQLREALAKARPDVKVTFRAPYQDYEDATQRVLREAVTGNVPDITFQGLNRVRVIADKGIAVSLDKFIAAEKDFEAAGFHKAMFDAGRVNDAVYGLPFAISLPIAYYNLDLVKRAGGNPDQLPTTWDGVIELAKKINALAPDIHGIVIEWSITGNWLWQAIIFADGGSMMSEPETRVAFDGEAGKAAIRTLA